MLVSFVTLVLSGEMTIARADLFLNGVDAGPGQDTITLLNVILPGGGTFSGTATQYITPTSDTIIITNATETGSGTLITSNTYNFNAGPASEYVSLNGSLAGPTVGAPSISGTADASTFSGPPAFVNIPLAQVGMGGNPDHFQMSQTLSGTISGPGTLTGTIVFTGGGTFTLPGAFSAAVPEPSSLVIAAIGAVGFIAHGLTRHRRDQQRQGPAGQTDATE